MLNREPSSADVAAVVVVTGVTIRVQCAWAERGDLS
jgi:hypothetical protein